MTFNGIIHVCSSSLCEGHKIIITTPSTGIRKQSRVKSVLKFNRCIPPECMTWEWPPSSSSSSSNGMVSITLCDPLVTSQQMPPYSIRRCNKRKCPWMSSRYVLLVVDRNVGVCQSQSVGRLRAESCILTYRTQKIQNWHNRIGFPMKCTQLLAGCLGEGEITWVECLPASRGLWSRSMRSGLLSGWTNVAVQAKR